MKNGHIQGSLEKRLEFAFIFLTAIFIIVLTACGKVDDGGKNTGAIDNSSIITSTPVSTPEQVESESTQIAGRARRSSQKHKGKEGSCMV